MFGQKLQKQIDELRKEIDHHKKEIECLKGDVKIERWITNIRLSTTADTQVRTVWVKHDWVADDQIKRMMNEGYSFHSQNGDIQYWIKKLS